MCVDNNVSERLQKKGVKIDAPFPRNMELAYQLMKKEGYTEGLDFLHISNQYQNQFTKVKYVKTTQEPDGRKTRHFVLTVPDRYVPSAETDSLQNVIKSEEDI